MPLVSFDTPKGFDTTGLFWKLKVFWCFQEVSKETSGMKWVIKLYLEYFIDNFTNGCKSFSDSTLMNPKSIRSHP